MEKSWSVPYCPLKNGAANIGIGIVRDGIRGGIVGGRDGIIKGIQFGQFNNAVGHLAGFIASGFGAPKFKNGAFVYEQAGIFRRGGLTMGNVVQLTITDDFKLNDFLLAHELAHIPQSNFSGALYLPMHAIAMSSAMLLSGSIDGHHSRFNPLECSTKFTAVPDVADCR